MTISKSLCLKPHTHRPDTWTVLNIRKCVTSYTVKDIRFSRQAGQQTARVAHHHTLQQARKKQPMPETSVAGTAIPGSGHDRARRGQNPGITQKARARARRSSIYARFCVSLAPRRRCKQPRPKTSIAGTAIVDSGNQHNTELLLCGFPPYPPKIGNRKPESHARKRIVVCMRFFSLPFQQVQALSTLFPTSFSSLPSLSPGRASTKSSLPTMRVARKRIG